MLKNIKNKCKKVCKKLVRFQKNPDIVEELKTKTMETNQKQNYVFTYKGKTYNNKKEMLEVLNITRRKWLNMVKSGTIIRVDL